MDAATGHVRALARRVTDAALGLGPLRAALLAGSGARGDCDGYSDVDLLFYVDELPPEGRLEALRGAVGGAEPIPFAPQAMQFLVGGVPVQASYSTVAQIDEKLDAALVRLEHVRSPGQKMLAGLLEGLPLHGEDVLERWRARVADYPEELRRAMVEQHWSFFPLWYYAEQMQGRDAELWRMDMLVDGVFNVLGVLAGVNRVYYARFELKRLRAFAEKLQLAPSGLAERLEALFRLAPVEAADELGRLVDETREIALDALPGLELRLRFPPGTRQQPWG